MLRAERQDALYLADPFDIVETMPSWCGRANHHLYTPKTVLVNCIILNIFGSH